VQLISAAVYISIPSAVLHGCGGGHRKPWWHEHYDEIGKMKK